MSKPLPEGEAAVSLPAAIEIEEGMPSTIKLVVVGVLLQALGFMPAEIAGGLKISAEYVEAIKTFRARSGLSVAAIWDASAEAALKAQAYGVDVSVAESQLRELMKRSLGDIARQAKARRAQRRRAGGAAV